MSRTASPEQASRRSPRGGAVSALPPQHRGWVGFEGIVASGKTTQSRLLADRIRSFNPEVVPEFGNHDLGRYLSEYGSPGMRLTPEGCDTSYVRHVLALASHAQKLEEASHRTAENIVLLDVATLTDAAYALADLPAEKGTEMWGRMKLAVEFLLAKVQPPTEDGILIYLDCKPTVAAGRLAERSGVDDEKQVEFLGRMYEAYEDLLDGRPGVRRVDANRAPDDVAASVWREVGRLFR